MTAREFKERLQEHHKYGNMAFQIRTADNDFFVSEMICDVLNREVWLYSDEQYPGHYTVEDLLHSLEEMSAEDDFTVYFEWDVHCSARDVLHAMNGQISAMNLTDCWTREEFEDDFLLICEADHSRSCVIDLYDHHILESSKDIAADDIEAIKEPDETCWNDNFPPVCMLPWQDFDPTLTKKQAKLLDGNIPVTIENDGYFDGTIVDVVGDFVCLRGDEEIYLDMSAIWKRFYQRILALYNRSDINYHRFEDFCIGSISLEVEDHHVTINTTIDS